MNRITLFSSLILIIGGLSACCSAKKTQTPVADQLSSIPGPKVIIYKTSKDYSKLVPVILSEDNKTLVSYPDVKDIYFNGKLAYPTKLHDGFLLDNRGIDRNVAFIKLTYDEYSKLDKTPTAEQLMEMLIDKDPLRRMYSCGVRSAYSDIEIELNSKIDAGDFSTFIKIK